MVEHGGNCHRLPPRVTALLGAALLAVLTGCSGGSGGTTVAASASGSRCPAASPAPQAEIALMPAGLSFAKFATVTQVRKAAGHVTAQAVTARPLDEVTVLIQDAVTAAGYRPAGMDNEDSEAEVFFTTGSYAAGQARVRRAACDGQWNIDLDLIEPRATPAPTATR